MTEDGPVLKSCGDCGLCCKLLGVEAIGKAPGKMCAHFRRGLGCRIYADRPAACGDFICYWLRAPNLDESWRPDRAGFVLHASEHGRILNVELDPARAQAWRAEPYQSRLRAWAAQGAARALELRVWNGRRCLRLTSAGEEDLGLQRPAVTLPKAKAARRSRAQP